MAPLAANSSMDSSQSNNPKFSCIACDQTGYYVAAGTSDGYVYTTANGGTLSWTCTPLTTTTTIAKIKKIVMSNSDSTYPSTLAVLLESGVVYISSDFGQTWVEIYTVKKLQLVDIAATNISSTPLLGIYSNTIFTCVNSNSSSITLTIDNSSKIGSGISSNISKSGGFFWASIESIPSSDSGLDYVFSGITVATDTVTNNGTITTTTNCFATGYYNSITGPGSYIGSYNPSTGLWSWTAQTTTEPAMVSPVSDSTGNNIVAIYNDLSTMDTTYEGLLSDPSWNEITSSTGVRVWDEVVSDASGINLAAIGSPRTGTYIYTSTTGATGSTSFTQLPTSVLVSADYVGIASDQTGYILWTCVNEGSIYNCVYDGTRWSSTTSL